MSISLAIIHHDDHPLPLLVISPAPSCLISALQSFLQNNNLTGQVPSNLAQKPGLTLRYTPGNPFLHP
ncbi:UNVERIFIED_CONTAM: hypothetical protein Sindi_0523200 [Sesamum indicum]